MKGQILVFNEPKQLGVLVALDGQRFTFDAAEWKEVVPPERGMLADFAAGEDGRALNLYLALPEPVGISGGDTAGSAAHGAPPAPATPFARQPKRKSTLTLLAIFLGSFGAHKFYLGAWGWGMVYALSWVGVFLMSAAVPAFSFLLLAMVVLILVEWIRYILMSDDTFQDKLKAYQAAGPGPFGFFW